MEDEISSLLQNDTWELCTLPLGRKTVKSKWVYKLKLDSRDDVAWHKAMIVNKGYSQILGIDFDKTFLPIIKHDSIKILLDITAAHDMCIIQYDVKTAYLCGDLDEELYMEQQEGFTKGDPTILVCRLKKSIYRLRQATGH